MTRSDVLMVAIVALISTAAALWSDRVPVNNGLGWDGQFYGEMAADPVGYTRRGELDDYQVQRILPSIVVHYALEAARVKPSTPHVIAAFEVLNVILLTAAAAMWVGIVRILRLRASAAWLGWLGLFVNYASLRQASYYAVLTDVSAFALGVGMLLCFLRGRTGFLALLMLLGAFVWPVASIVGLALLALPREPLPEDRRGRGSLAIITATGAATATLLLSSYMYFVKHVVWHPAITQTIPLSILLATLFVAISSESLLRGLDFSDVRALLARLRWRDVAIAVAVLFSSRFVQHLLIGTVRGSYFRRMLRTLATLAVAKPLNFYVPHVVYFGPLILLAAMLWPAVAREARRWGLGYVCVILLSIGLALNSESRQTILGYPFLVAATALAAQRRGWSLRANVVLCIIGVVASKIWMRMPIGTGPITDADLVRFPMQWYFMNHGPWMNVSMFLLQSCAVTAAAISIGFIIRAERPSPGRDEPSQVGEYGI